jgi:predicted NBD/HSP70 family sugar kinase
MTILVIDVGGTHVKVKLQGKDEVLKLPSGPTLAPAQMVEMVRQATASWEHDVVTIGIPAPLLHDKVVLEPVNLGKGWMGFDFGAALGKPVKLINDAAMQALGSYQGGRMLFLGLGTGLGTAMVLDGQVSPMELGHLPYKKGRSFEEYVGTAALKRMGRRKWEATVFDIVGRLKSAVLADYVVLGGGNAKKLDELPPATRLGDNGNAFVGGERVWEEAYRERDARPGPGQ